MTLEERLFYPSPRSSPAPEFKSSTIIIPSISIGNVPQLTIDLLVTTLDIPLVGYLTSPYLVPCAGTREECTTLDKCGVACPLEVYFDKERKLTVIQQRSPFISHSMKTPFVRELWKFLSCYGFSKVIMLASSDAARRTDEQITGPKFQVIKVDDPNTQPDLSESLAKLTLSTPTTLTSVPTTPSPFASSVGAKGKHFPASGHLRQFIRMAEQDMYSKREVVALVMFAAEGDNSADAKEMASIISKVINLEIKEWKAPKSWEGVFGGTLRQGAEEGLFW